MNQKQANDIINAMVENSGNAEQERAWRFYRDSHGENLILKDVLRWYIWLVKKNKLENDVPKEIRIAAMVGLGVARTTVFFKENCKTCGQKLLKKMRPQDNREGPSN